MKDDRLYLIHMSECIARIEEYVREGKDVFMSSSLIQDAVIQNLQTMAESIKRISEDLKTQHPEVDWREISGFRNVLVHGYLNVDLLKVWLIVERKIPDLKKKIDAILAM
jgi:uncharacterized protein with HEPN domain